MTARVLGLVLCTTLAVADEWQQPVSTTYVDDRPVMAAPLPTARLETAAGVGNERPAIAPLTLERLQWLGLQHNPTLQEARAETDRARGQILQAGLYPNPRVGYTSSDIGLLGTAGQQGVFVSQTFITGCKLPLSQRIFRADLDRANWQVAEQELRVVNGIRGEFYAVLAAERLVSVSTDLVEIGRDVVEATQRRFDANEGTKIDLLQAKVALRESQLLATNAKRRRTAAWRRLEAAVGAPLSESSIIGDLEADAPDLEFDPSLARLLASSPQLQRAQATVNRARAAVTRATVEPIPNITVQASTSYDFTANDQIAGVQVGLPLPVNNRNQGNVRSAHAEYVRSAREVERLELVLRRNLADAFRDYDVARQQAVAFKRDILPTSRETLKLSRDAFDAGELTYLQVLAVQREYIEANRRYVQALGEFWWAVVAIDGLLLDDALTAPARIGGP